MSPRTSVNLSDYSVGVNTQDTFVLAPYFPRNFLLLKNNGPGACAVSFDGNPAATNSRASIMLPATGQPVIFKKAVPQNAIHARSASFSALTVLSDDVIPAGVNPFWLLTQNPAPVVDVNFLSRRYWVNNAIATDPNVFLTTTRTTTNGLASDLLPSSPSGATITTFSDNVPRVGTTGLIDDEGRTNNLLASTVPATQTTASLGTGTYTLWVNGSGTAQASVGTATAPALPLTASQGTPINFTITVAGTIVVTVAGSLNAFQLELGVAGTSLIVTTAAAGVRGAEVTRLTNFPALGAAFTMFAQGTGFVAAGGNTAFYGLLDDGTTNNSAQLPIQPASGNPFERLNVGGVAQFNDALSASDFRNVSCKSALALADGSQAGSAAGGAVVTHTISPIISPTAAHLGCIPTGGSQSMVVERFALWAQRLSNSTLVSITT